MIDSIESSGDEYTLEDFVYDELDECQPAPGSDEDPTYSRDKFMRLFQLGDHQAPSDFAGRSHYVEGEVWVDDQGKAVYGLVNDEGEDSVELDIIMFGDAEGVRSYLEDVPGGERKEGIDSVKGRAFQGSYSRMGAKTDGNRPEFNSVDAALDEPGDVPDESFTNSQAERIKNKVMEEE